MLCCDVIIMAKHIFFWEIIDLYLDGRNSKNEEVIHYKRNFI